MNVWKANRDRQNIEDKSSRNSRMKRTCYRQIFTRQVLVSLYRFSFISDNRSVFWISKLIFWLIGLYLICPFFLFISLMKKFSFFLLKFQWQFLFIYLFTVFFEHILNARHIHKYHILQHNFYSQTHEI